VRRVQQVQQVQQVHLVITLPKIRITITRTGMLVTNFILTLLEIQMDHIHITQVIPTHFTHMGTMLTTFIMVLIILPHPTCLTLATQTGILMLLLTFFPFGRELFTDIMVVIENINLMSMRRRLLTLSTFTIQPFIVLEAQQVQQVQQVRQELRELQEPTVQQVWREAMDQMVLEDLPRHHRVRAGLVKEAGQVVEEV